VRVSSCCASAAAVKANDLAPILDAEPEVALETTAAFGPPTVANLGPGFDWLGCAVEGAGDVVKATIRRDIPGKVEIASIEGDGGRLSLEPEQNCCGIAAIETLNLLGVKSVGVELEVFKGLPLGSGLGSSAASAAAAAWAVNSLFGAPLSKADLVPAGLASEAFVSGYHADNIAPAIMGSFVLVSSYEPLTLVPLRYGAEEAWFVVVTPVFEAPTRKMRAALPTEIPFKAHVKDSASGAGLVAGVLQGDAAALGKCLNSDTLVEPARGKLIPGFEAVKEAALGAGAFGCTISGAGPTSVAVVPSPEVGADVAAAMMAAFQESGGLEVERALVVKLNGEGARTCSPGMESTVSDAEVCIVISGAGC